MRGVFVTRASIILCSIWLAGCGSDGGSSVVSTINGLAATGAAMADASVTIKCSAGDAATGKTGADGTFSVALNTAQSVPCLVEVSNSTATLHSFAVQEGYVNVTPLTELVVAKALGADPVTAFASLDAAKITTVNNGLAAAKTYVAAEIKSLIGTAPSGDLLTQAFKIGDADDKVLDAFAAKLKATNRGFGQMRLAAASGSSLAAMLSAEEQRLQDVIPYAVSAEDAAATTFPAMASAAGESVDMKTTSRWAGVLNGAAYRVEVPVNWNGKLVMYAHGFVPPTTSRLSVDNPRIRRYLIQNGYAWAASSYSKNSYDVRAGVEDTNALALSFTKIAAANSRTLAAPSKIYITGISLGGHVTAAAIEEETYATSNNKVKYAGAVPMCGVVGDTDLFSSIAAMRVAAQAFAGEAKAPVAGWNPIAAKVTQALFYNFPAPGQAGVLTEAGIKYMSVVKNLTGGERPLATQGFLYGGSFGAPYSFFGVDGTIFGIFNKSAFDTSKTTFVIDGDAAGSAKLNADALRLTADADYNRLRRDGLRWVPKVNGQFKIPVVTIHTLGDYFVPFSMEQIYRQRADASGNGGWLVQRAIRGATHCDFTRAEEVKAFDDMIKWERDGIKPTGDDVLTPAVVAAASYGCTHTINTVGADDDASTAYLRQNVIAPTAACPK